MHKVTDNHDNDMLEQASAFSARLASGDMRSGTWLGFADWLERDPAHRRLFGAMEELSSALGHLGNDIGRRRVQRVAPGLVEFLEDAERFAAKKKRGTIKISARMLAMAAGLLLVVAVPLIHRGGLNNSSQPWIIETPDSARMTHEFGEGTTLTLGGTSRVSLLAGGSQRQLMLEHGQIHLEVEPGGEVPLQALVDGHVVAVTGTAFSISKRHKGSRVTVFEGEVDVFRKDGDGPSPGLARSVSLKAGQQLELFGGSPPVDLQTEALRNASSWRDGWLHFENARLEEIVNELEWHMDRRFVIGSDKAAGLPLAGSFNIDRLDTVITALESLLPVEVSESGDLILIDYREFGN